MKQNKIKVSIIIRVKDEEKWITSCLRSVFNQKYTNFEVIIVNNQSKDNTIKNIKDFNVKVVNIKNFFPGKAINYGIKKAKGEIVVCLSGHCIPKDKFWLGNIIKHLSKKNIAGVYGKQEPLSFSKPNDKRDLKLTFGMDIKIQKKDYFFHNANSAFKKEIWKKYPFNEKITNIEDREWGKRVIGDGLKIIYEPKASVYHYHGIHQNLKKERAISVSNIMDIIDNDEKYKKKTLNNSKIFVIIPFNSNLELYQSKYLIQQTIEEAEKSKFVKNIVLSVNNKKINKHINSKFLREIFIRPEFLKGEHISIGDIIHNSLEEIEMKYSEQDIIVVMDPSQPFRPNNIIDKMMLKLKKTKSDSILAVYPERRNIFNYQKNGRIDIDESNFIPRYFKENNYMISLFGTCFITYAKFIRENSFFGKKIVSFNINNNISYVQIRNKKDFYNLKKIKAFINNL